MLVAAMSCSLRGATLRYTMQGIISLFSLYTHQEQLLKLQGVESGSLCTHTRRSHPYRRFVKK